MSSFKPELGKPVRFLAVEWREHWDFDHPTVLIEPVFRYSPDGESLDGIIEDAAIDVCIAAEKGEGVRVGIHPSTQKEFDWREWDVEQLRTVAEARLGGEEVEFGIGYVGVLEQIVVFRKGGDEIIWDVVNEKSSE